MSQKIYITPGRITGCPSHISLWEGIEKKYRKTHILPGRAGGQGIGWTKIPL